MTDNLYTLLQYALTETDPDEKCRLARAARQGWREGSLKRQNGAAPLDLPQAGCPAKPELVPPQELAPRNPKTAEGYAAMLHAVCHIEFNAVNLALDAAYRFRTMPDDFVSDWLKVAEEEALHFELMRERVRAQGFDYGSFPAHGKLWEMAAKTAYDPLLRMALVPRVLEARGLDVTPAIRAKVAQRGDTETCDVLDVVYRDEVGHVRIGNFWYQVLCRERGLEPMALFCRLLSRYDLFVFRGYVNLEARERAGFSAFELAMLSDFEGSLKAGAGKNTTGN